MFVFFLSFSSFIIFNVRKKFTFIEMPKVSLREGFFVGLAVAVLAFLSSQGLLWFWDAFFLILTLSLIEIFLLSKKGRNA
jgi:hypothetical protein